MKETLEEAAENSFNDFQSKNPIVPQKHILPFKLGYIDGAKWQAENIIEELEMHILLNEDDWNRNPQAEFKKFAEKFKKK
jgi:hypothetical protein